ncbi:thioredoxin peroxidase dot5 [Yamadazyma tenuis]|uniref:thioredoxin-dependent peroxiredoxin n=1 Tax=Candida tenuis (strain ATCC 10573 / BCRC 21748 / CBS 615 / JCM 9827 / NBRC 10315 / NRRL Y-1498 / VKM Y-70) TaxID=590646 RepID=G3B9T0_CANTC|nr:thioredoxin-like protein [Yamadazyma tenuis ATCC 10573]EGV61962.1 thioredoxin-like protein [Yamadazyma tenuis ATCC 10573]WEJ93208.1 thioredoxin peroxidase dot5 [Yamadazyma tenuis]
MVELRRSTRNANKNSIPQSIDESKDKVLGSRKSKVTKPAKKVTKIETKSKMAEIQVGDRIPDLTLLDEDDNEINLVEASKKTKYVVIFAYPKASTPGCTRQVCGFQKNHKELIELDTTVFGLSADLPKSQKNFIVKQGLEYHLLSDPNKELIGPLGAKKEPTGIKRSHWIFEDGVLKIKKIQISPEDSFNGALEDIQALKA